MTEAAAPAAPLTNGNAAGLEIYPGTGTRPNGKPKLPSMTQAGIERYAAREPNAVGPTLVRVRLAKFGEAMRQPEVKLQIGAMEDAAAALIAHAAHLRLIHHIPPKT